ncbi:MAG: bifunctional (p)ppGpp synthetase/guanosine-3',5'-bis(diphosphate) 3'-pyrophosphohydrolase, partial [Bacilli bacterium]|nr:bifunctional (p)ppGpp synthetase/guanosine-3',5'-bis(diphosphate) 3'-pyrophosphohydrolase [Bacilli bacterium]
MMEIQDIISILKEKNQEAIPDVIKAYEIAESAHRGTLRESGEPYIIHPLHVTKNLLDMEIYDKDTLCAALLHDVVEDTEVTLEDIEHALGKTVRELVDGVTKMRRMNFPTKKEQNDANERKIVSSLTKDMRIVIIKLADRLHNMRTLQYKKPIKQKQNAVETMRLYVPLSLYIGAYQVKSELEDLALMYMEPGEYQDILGQREELGKVERAYLQEIKTKMEAILKEQNIPNDILVRTRNIGTIWRKIRKGYELKNIYDIFYLKVLVEEVNDCYRTLRYVHELIPPINGRLKDYIFTPRTNDYRSLHTTGCDQNGKDIKTKIRTIGMDKVSANGKTAYWIINPNLKEGEFPRRKSIPETQAEIVQNVQCKMLQEHDSTLMDDEEFLEAITQETLAEHIYINMPDKGT